MFDSIRTRLLDMKTIARLCTAAERHAHAAGRHKPGSEHFVLAALELPDGTAQQTLATLGVSTVALREVMAAGGKGTDGHGVDRGRSAIYEADPSGQALMQRLAASIDSRDGRALVGADVLLALAHEELTFAISAFERLGVTPRQLESAARETIFRAPSG